MGILERLGWKRNSGGNGTAALDQAGARTILLVDDEIATQKTVEKALGGAGYRVVSTPSAGEARRWLNERSVRPAMLLVNPAVPEMNGLDEVPGMGGYDLVNAVRRLPGDSLPVVVLSDSDDDLSMMRCYMEGADYFLPKPFPPHRLLAVIRQMTGTARSPAQQARILACL